MNIIYSFLKQLGVRRISQSYCLQQYLSTPHADTLLGIKRLLDNMGVPTRGVRYEDPATSQPEFPAIVHLGYIFDVATAKNWPDLQPQWDGVALMPLDFDRTKVVEPNYRKRLFMRLFEGLCIAALLLIPLFLAFSTSLFNFQPSPFNFQNSTFPIHLSIFVIDLLGLLVGFLLLQKSITGQSRLGDGLCGALSKKRSCGDVLNSSAAHILGFSWSEIGFGYFAAHLFLMLLIPFSSVMPSSTVMPSSSVMPSSTVMLNSFQHLPMLSSALAFVGLCAMGFAFWSIGYQWRHHSWCVLCLITQALLWAEGILLLVVYNPFSVFASWPAFGLLVFCGLCFACAILVVHFVACYLFERRKRQSTEWSFRGLLQRHEVFQALLSASSSHPYTEADINERLGNPDIPLDDCLVIYTSPEHCPHCKALLPKEEDFLRKMEGRMAIAHINIDKIDPDQQKATSERLSLDATPRLLYRHRLIPDTYTIDDLPTLL